LAGSGGYRSSRFVGITASLGKAWGLVNLSPQIEDGQPRNRAEPEQYPPDETGGYMRGQKDRGDQRTHYQPSALHGEDQADHPAA
jgi:hypothetical protein